MSESDRIRNKRIATELKIQKFNPVFDSGDYTEFKSFSLINNTKNTHLEVDDLDSSNLKILNYFDVKKNNVLDASGNSHCQNYLCEPYNMWPNRVPLGDIYSDPAPKKYFYWDSFLVCFGSLQGSLITSLPHNRNATTTDNEIKICNTQLMVSSYPKKLVIVKPF